MAREDDDDAGLPPVGEDTERFLDEAKKGKARAFLLICKGSKVKYLKVKKKPVKAAEVTEAKKLGYKGDVYIGVIDGQGMNLVFNLCAADGYTDGPVKDSILRAFLDEQVGFKSKPTFAIVPQLPELPLDDEDMGVETAAPVAAAASAVAGAPATGDAASTPSDSTPSQPVAAATTDDALKAKLTETLNKLVPQIKQAIAKAPTRQTEILGAVAKVKQQLEADDLQAAKAGILELAALLKSMNEGTPASTTADNSLKSEYESKLSALQPLYDQALQQSLGDTGRYRAVMAYVLEQGEAGGFVNAIKALDRLRGALELLLSPAQSQAVDDVAADDDDDSDELAEEVGGVSIFKLSKARIEWQSTRMTALRELQRLRAILQEEYLDDLESKASLDATFSHIDRIINSLNEELGECLDEILNAEAAKRMDLIPIAQKILDRFIAFVDEDETLKAVDGNEYAPEMLVALPLKNKLDAISDALGVNSTK